MTATFVNEAFVDGEAVVIGQGLAAAYLHVDDRVAIASGMKEDSDELMQLTVETKMSTAMEVRKASTSEQKILLIASWSRGSNVVGVWRA